jgi:hypothetical protein
VSSPSATTLRRRGVALADGVGGSVVGGVGSSGSGAAAAAAISWALHAALELASARRSTASVHVAAQAGRAGVRKTLNSSECLLLSDGRGRAF